MSEQYPTSRVDSEIKNRLDNFDANKPDDQALFEESLIGEAGKTDFSDEARTRLEEASAYEDHLKSMAGRDEAHDPFEAGLDALDRGESADALSRAIEESPQLRRANMIAQDIARRRAEGGAENDAYVIDQEAKLESLLNEYTDKAGDEDVALRIIEATAHSTSSAEAATTSEEAAPTAAEVERGESTLSQAVIEAAQAARAEAKQSEEVILNEENKQAAVAAREAALVQDEEVPQEEAAKQSARPAAPVKLDPSRPVAEQLSPAETNETTTDESEQEPVVATKKRRRFGRGVLGRVFRGKKHEAIAQRYRQIQGDEEAALPSRVDRSVLGVGVGVSEWQQAKKEIKQERKADKKQAKLDKKAARKEDEARRYEANWRSGDQAAASQSPEVVEAAKQDPETPDAEKAA